MSPSTEWDSVSTRPVGPSWRLTSSSWLHHLVAEWCYFYLFCFDSLLENEDTSYWPFCSAGYDHNGMRASEHEWAHAPRAVSNVGHCWFFLTSFSIIMGSANISLILICLRTLILKIKCHRVKHSKRNYAFIIWVPIIIEGIKKKDEDMSAGTHKLKIPSQKWKSQTLPPVAQLSHHLNITSGPGTRAPPVTGEARTVSSWEYRTGWDSPQSVMWICHADLN